MAPRRFPSQKSIFYDDFWTEYVDLGFVIQLEEEASRLGMALTKQSKISIQRAREEVNFQFCTVFTKKYCEKRFQKLEERYKTFSELIEMPEFIYDEESNTLHADSRVWDEICMTNELGVAYRYEGEPCWEYLQRIFGREAPNEVIRQVEVINISSDNNDLGVHPTGQRTNSLTRNSGTLNGPSRGASGASSTGRSFFLIQIRKGPTRSILAVMTILVRRHLVRGLTTLKKYNGPNVIH